MSVRVTQASFADELAAAPANRRVGTALWFENERIRVWELRLEPGDRAPFHTHATAYFWTCVSAGRAIQRFPDGREERMAYVEGQTTFNECSEDEPLIHNLENTGDTVLRFVTVELLPGG